MATTIDTTSGWSSEAREPGRFFSRISWSAVLSGVVIAFLLNTLLNLVGLGIGLATLDPASGDSPGPRQFGVGAGMWWTVSGLIALYVGGWVAARLSGRLHARDGAWHGLVTWAAMGVLSLMVLSTAVGSTVGGALSALGEAAPAVAQAAERNVDTIPAGAGEARGAPREAAFGSAAENAMPEAREAAERSAKAGSAAALWAALALVLGACAAAFGGRAGSFDDAPDTVTTTTQRGVSGS